MTQQSLGFPGGTVVKSLPANAADLGDESSILESARSSGAANGNPLQYSCLESFMNSRAWTDYGVGHDCAHMQGKANDLAIRILYIYPGKNINQKDTYTPLFIVALFPVDRT